MKPTESSKTTLPKTQGVIRSHRDSAGFKKSDSPSRVEVKAARSGYFTCTSPTSKQSSSFTSGQKEKPTTLRPEPKKRFENKSTRSKPHSEQVPEYHFDVNELIEAATEFRKGIEGKGKLTLRTNSISIPEPAPHFAPKQIIEIRSRLNLSQPLFAAAMNVPEVTVRSWERGIRKPQGSARRLLQIAMTTPSILLKGIEHPEPGAAGKE